MSAAKRGSGANKLVGMDVYSTDGELLGRVTGYRALSPEDAAEYQGVSVAIGSPGPHADSRQVLIDAVGFPAQVEIAIPEEQVHVEPDGAYATINVSSSEIRGLHQA